MYNPGQNSLAKCILFFYFQSHAHMSTLYKIFGTLFPPPTSMLLFLIKSLGKRRVLPLTTLILGEGNRMTSFATYFVHDCRYDDRIRSSDVLQSLGWDTLHVRWAKLKSVLLYKILNENYSPCLRDTLVKLRDLKRRYNL